MYGLSPVYKDTFHNHFYNEIRNDRRMILFHDIFRSVKHGMPIMSEEEWDVASIYVVAVFRKTGNIIPEAAEIAKCYSEIDYS